MSSLKKGKELLKITRRSKMKNKLSYLLFAVFIAMILIAVTCNKDKSENSMTITPKAEAMEIIEEKVEEPVEQPAEEPVEEVEKVEEVIEIVEPVEVPLDLIPPVDTLERKEFYDKYNWKYDDTIPGVE